MIIVSNKPGQLGNLLFIYANLMAYGLEHGTQIFNPSFYPYQAYFEGTKKRSRVLYKWSYQLAFMSARILNRLPFKIPGVSVKSLDWTETYRLDVASELVKSKLYFLQGWLFRAPRLVEKHQKTIRAFFTPVKTYTTQMDQFFQNQVDLHHETVIAVHIRRGDYKYFEGGKYFYSMDDYAEVIKKTARLFPSSKLNFLLCSNEPVNVEELKRGDYKVTLALNHELLDMYSMARCHYIIGPPSTYTMWASVYGQVPLYKIQELNKDMTLAEFHIHPSF